MYPSNSKNSPLQEGKQGSEEDELVYGQYPELDPLLKSISFFLGRNKTLANLNKKKFKNKK